MWTNWSCPACSQELVSTRKAPEFGAVVGENGAKLRSLSWWREFRLQCTKHQPKRTNITADISATRRNNIQDFPFWQEKNFVEVKRLNVTCGFFWTNRRNSGVAN
jgi:hypothetical protein